MLSRTGCLSAAPPSEHSPAALSDYEEPKLLAGNIFAPGPGPQKLLFKFQRTASRTGTTVKVTREYTYPDGSLAARDRIVYEAGQLASLATDEFQTGDRGSAVVRPDPKGQGQRRVFFDYTTGQGVGARKSSDSERVEHEALVDDMIPAFIVSHWDALVQGAPATFRFIVPSRTETVGFKLVKDSETLWRGSAAVRLKMEPTSFIIAQLVDPIFFIVEKGGRHHILEYVGRTTPVIRNGNKWKELDAVIVYDWK
jgi:hypothetical protein